jgi:hypothetical protein
VFVRRGGAQESGDDLFGDFAGGEFADAAIEDGRVLTRR